jgi:uncharacterized protein
MGYHGVDSLRRMREFRTGPVYSCMSPHRTLCRSHCHHLEEPVLSETLPVSMAAELPEVLRRIRVAVEPHRVILFGSAARGEASATSDLDMLIVMPTGSHRRRTAQAIYRALVGIATPVDVVVVTEDDLERYAHTEGMVIAHALAEGQVLDAA